MKVKQRNMIKRMTDVGLTVLLLCLMAYQVTGEALHEWLGIGMTVLVFAENIAILLFFAFIGMQSAALLKKSKKGKKEKVLFPILLMIIPIVIGSILFTITAF